MTGTPSPDRARASAGRPAPPRILALAALLLGALAAAASPSAGIVGDEPFTFPANSGLTGLLETPTARVLREHRYRLGTTYVSPYYFYYGAISPFRRIEVTGRITGIRDVPGFYQGSPYGNYKDKAFDAKFQILPEGKYAPAVAVVLQDPHGTRRFAAQSVVASKQIFPFDLSIGLGNGRFGKDPLPAQGEGFRVELLSHPKAWWNAARPFGGIQFAPSEKYAVLAEYSPIRYDRQTNDPAQPVHFTSPVPSPWNFGLRWKPVRWAEIDASWQRGNRFGLGLSVAFDIGRPVVPIYDPPWRETPADRKNPLEDRIAAALLSSGFSDVGIAFDGVVLRVEAQNDRYLFTARAVAVILEVLAQTDPERIEYVQILLKENGIPSAAFATTGHGIAALRAGEIGREPFLDASRFRTDAATPAIPQTTGRRLFDWEVRPAVDTFLNDPSGFFKYRIGAAATLRSLPWRGGAVVLGIEGYPVNTVSTTNQPLSIPIRSDVALYKKEKVTLGRLLGEQAVKLPGEIHARAAAGLLDVQLAGIDGETAFPVMNGRFLFGASGSLVRKRDPDDALRVDSGKEFHAALGLARLNIPEIESWVDVKAGRFLAGDKGARFSVSKSINGVVLSAWYSETRTSMFSDPYNRGYHDKGISVAIPVRLFLGRDSRTVYRFALSPWTRDVAQDVDRTAPLFDRIGRNAGAFLDRDRQSLFTVGKQ